MKDNKLIHKLEQLKDLYEEFLKWDSFYHQWEGIHKDSAFLSSQKKAEELVEYAIKINRELLKKKNIFSHSYKESFLQLENIGFEKEFTKKLSEITLFRNKMAHEYLNISDEEIKFELDNLKILFPKYIKKIAEIVL